MLKFKLLFDAEDEPMIVVYDNFKFQEPKLILTQADMQALIKEWGQHVQILRESR